MAFKQPRVPEYRESEGADRYIRSLVLFLKDFCMDVWTANNQRSGEIDAVKGGLSGIHYPVTSVCGKTGEVTLTADDVGARPGSWTPTASDVGALEADGTAADSSKLGGLTLAQLMLTVYPVGAIYTSVSSVSPASLFGGTWEPLQNRFLLGASDYVAAGSTGGEYEHTLTYDEMPSHTHGICTTWDNQWNKDWPAWTGYAEFSQKSTTISRAANYTTAEGGGAAHNNMPPYLAVYMWKRVG